MSSPPTLPRAQQARSRRTQQQILDAGTSLLEEGGAEALTVAAVAARAGVAVGSVYRRFGDKDRLLAALQHDMIDQFRADIIERFTPIATDPASLVAAAVVGLTETYEAHERLMQVFMTAGASDAAVAHVGSQASIDAGKVFLKFLEPVTVCVPSPDPETRLDFIYRLICGTCAHRIVNGEKFESERALPWKKLTEELVTVARSYLLGEGWH
ncbi:TetR family transcriptional regulator (plasmid) [Rhodococcus erythropolis R138]|uniref:TetR/AcrR family transcriptional regulator n=1 Tax=Rhodococcus erythropolis TaxID=1833 RepID=UPI00049256EC|nr:TetR/AcrR family transcriptional regulator [Rhodococcus erythropolis]ALU73463.1 TetR family transcriptional regulator [Rhodococcus erythropolis R138]